jgi:RHS repeat-associated protein
MSPATIAPSLSREHIGDEYEHVLLNTDPDFQPLGYAGGLYDNDTKLVRFGARDYDSYTGRWTAKDPIGFGGGSSNLYQYCTNEPINNSDPSGLWDPRGHTVLTETAMRSLGFNQKFIDLAVASNLWVDREKNTFNDAQHAMPGSNIEEIMAKVNYYFNKAVEEKCKGNDDATAIMLGISLHTIQDYWVHFVPDYGWMSHILGWTHINRDMDDISLNPIWFGNAKNSTLRTLSNFIKISSKR